MSSSIFFDGVTLDNEIFNELLTNSRKEKLEANNKFIKSLEREIDSERQVSAFLRKELETKERLLEEAKDAARDANTLYHSKQIEVYKLTEELDKASKELLELYRRLNKDVQ